ncbi:hypothetical protein KFL_008960030 [Klebsormidium nitens]|uniref:2-phosphoglycerate kinase n=1 Tax=Klebsormidium nitens TaxID=105231 RepID=A0A1Y1IR76_KLENI|nr:hypothetical protein KFL_008960030 [Klebsormidium nitens]|eukprot:GAQ91979.1 hypothetical protein KFL_008960030 [Klebsormidium nitens]
MALEEEEEKSKPPRRTSSKYDFVKVKVWIGENSDHYYVLSRFLVSRMLTVTKISNVVAIKIALELKKLLVDNNLLDVSQADLEANLFKLMQKRGYGEEYVNRYKMMTNFHHQRVPLLVLVGGTACVGKSTIATQLAQRLNLPNVLQTDIIYELLRTDPHNAAPLNAMPLWARSDLTTTEDLMQEFRRECRVIRKGVDGDLTKTMSDGKPLIMEGLHLDPGIYLTELPQAQIRKPAKHEKLHPSESLRMADRRRRRREDSGAGELLQPGEERESLRQNGAGPELKRGKDLLTSRKDLLTSRSANGRTDARRGVSVHGGAHLDRLAVANDRKQRRSKSRLGGNTLAEAKEFLLSLAERNPPRETEKVTGTGVKRSVSSCHVAGEWEASPRGGRGPANAVTLEVRQQARSDVRADQSARAEVDEATGLLNQSLKDSPPELSQPERGTAGPSDLGVAVNERSRPGVDASEHLGTGGSASRRARSRSRRTSDTAREASERSESGNVLNGRSERASRRSERASDAERRASETERTERNGTEAQHEDPIVVQIVLRMSEDDHRTLVEEWLASRSGEVAGDVALDKAAVLQKLRTIQDYLCSFEDHGVAVVDVSTTSFAQTLDWLHSYLLECIEGGWSGAES